jgi:hypothetical protein
MPYIRLKTWSVLTWKNVQMDVDAVLTLTLPMKFFGTSKNGGKRMALDKWQSARISADVLWLQNEIDIDDIGFARLQFYAELQGYDKRIPSKIKEKS